jgi:autonomous glycyl radical cofactor GrcA
MEKSLEQHRRQLIREALEHWDEKGELRDIESDPVVKLLFSALAYQSHSISREISNMKDLVVTEYRNKLIPYHLIKPFPAFSLLETKLGKNKDASIKPLAYFMVDEKCVFEFGKNRMPFTPLFTTKIVDAVISDKQIDNDNNTIILTLSSNEIIEDFSCLSFYFEDSQMIPDIEISFNKQFLPLIKSDDCNNLPFTDWFQHQYLLREENQLQYGNYDYWLEFMLKNHVYFIYIGEYDCNKIRNTSTSPAFKLHFKNRMELQYFQNRTIKINCMPVLNVQKQSVTLNNNEPFKKLTADKSVFLNLLIDDDTEKNGEDYYIRHFGIERYNQEELLFRINDLFNRFITDYYAFKDIEELKKGDKLENLYKDFRELWPILMRNDNRNYSGVYAILKLNKNLRYQYNDVRIDYLTTNGKLANDLKEGEKAVWVSEFLNKANTVLLKDTTGGKEEEYNEAALNHLARYNLVTKDKLITVSDLKAFCYRELKNKIRSVSVQNTGKSIAVNIVLKEDYTLDPKETSYYETLIMQKIKVRSLFSLPVYVKIM